MIRAILAAFRRHAHASTALEALELAYIGERLEATTGERASTW